VSPLAVARDAVVIDTTGVSVQDVVSRALALVDRAMAVRG
jgi:cytidylate kinase